MCLPGTVEAVREACDRREAPRVSRRAALAGGGAAALAALMPAGAAAHHDRGRKRGRERVADLTHVFREGFPVYIGATPVREPLNNIPEHGFYAQTWTFGEHSGTHMDAPGHFTAGGRLTTDLLPSELFAPIAVIDVRRRAADDPDTAVSEEDIRRHEKRYGRIPRGAAVLMRSGWDSRAGDDAAFKNADANGVYHFPGFGADAAELLMERDALAIGVDTMSLDPGNSTTFEVHVEWLGDDRYGLEGVANLGAIPARGATLIVGVIPWEEGSGGPCRLLATY
jgi:kynurenine formamidase